MHSIEGRRMVITLSEKVKEGRVQIKKNPSTPNISDISPKYYIPFM
jgi:hypothetical protein